MKKLFSTIISLAIGVILFQPVFCQTKNVAGYIIRLNGDTVRGFIKQMNWESNPDQIEFTESQNTAGTVYTPKTILGFSINNDTYVGATVKTEVSPIAMEVLESNSILNLETKTTFLQTLIKGEKSLYTCSTKNSKEQFYIKQDSVYELLIYKRFIKNINGRLLYSENKAYIGQLSQYFKDYSGIMSLLDGLEYNRTDFEKLFLTYYGKTKKDIKFHQQITRYQPEFGVIAGLSLTELNFAGTRWDYLVNMDYPVSPFISGGFFIDLPVSRGEHRWLLGNDLIFTSYRVKGTYEDYVGVNQYTTYTTELQNAYLKLHTLVKYRFPVGKLLIYLNAGVSNGYMISEKNYQKKTKVFYESTIIEEGKVLDETRKYELGVMTGLGVSYKKYSFEVRYEAGKGMSVYTALSSKMNRYFIFLGYRF